ncbi:hypothetical protein Q8F55_008644 [Vanrija albida]|uniref:Uncharacterized protein n=1 Tax=Vanrija albida TaxID=181172 RepID=A0ABR3PRD4_9TREE
MSGFISDMVYEAKLVMLSGIIQAFTVFILPLLKDLADNHPQSDNTFTAKFLGLRPLNALEKQAHVVDYVVEDIRNELVKVAKYEGPPKFKLFAIGGLDIEAFILQLRTVFAKSSAKVESQPPVKNDPAPVVTAVTVHGGMSSLELALELSILPRKLLSEAIGKIDFGDSAPVTPPASPSPSVPTQGTPPKVSSKWGTLGADLLKDLELSLEREKASNQEEQQVDASVATTENDHGDVATSTPNDTAPPSHETTVEPELSMPGAFTTVLASDTLVSDIVDANLGEANSSAPVDPVDQVAGSSGQVLDAASGQLENTVGASGQGPLTEEETTWISVTVFNWWINKEPLYALWYIFYMKLATESEFVPISPPTDEMNRACELYLSLDRAMSVDMEIAMSSLLVNMRYDPPDVSNDVVPEYSAVYAEGSSQPTIQPEQATPAEATIAEATPAEATPPEAALPEATLPEATLPDAPLPDASLPDASLHDATLTGATLLEATLLVASGPSEPQAVLQVAGSPAAVALSPPDATTPVATSSAAIVADHPAPAATLEIHPLKSTSVAESKELALKGGVRSTGRLRKTSPKSASWKEDRNSPYYFSDVFGKDRLKKKSTEVFARGGQSAPLGNAVTAEGALMAGDQGSREHRAATPRPAAPPASPPAPASGELGSIRAPVPDSGAGPGGPPTLPADDSSQVDVKVVVPELVVPDVGEAQPAADGERAGVHVDGLSTTSSPAALGAQVGSSATDAQATGPDANQLAAPTQVPNTEPAPLAGIDHADVTKIEQPAPTQPCGGGQLTQVPGSDPATLASVAHHDVNKIEPPSATPPSEAGQLTQVPSQPSPSASAPGFHCGGTKAESVTTAPQPAGEQFTAQSASVPSLYAATAQSSSLPSPSASAPVFHCDVAMAEPLTATPQPVAPQLNHQPHNLRAAPPVVYHRDEVMSEPAPTAPQRIGQQSGFTQFIQQVPSHLPAAQVHHDDADMAEPEPSTANFSSAYGGAQPTAQVPSLPSGLVPFQSSVGTQQSGASLIGAHAVNAQPLATTSFFPVATGVTQPATATHQTVTGPFNPQADPFAPASSGINFMPQAVVAVHPSPAYQVATQAPVFSSPAPVTIVTAATPPPPTTDVAGAGLLLQPGQQVNTPVGDSQFAPQVPTHEAAAPSAGGFGSQVRSEMVIDPALMTEGRQFAPLPKFDSRPPQQSFDHDQTALPTQLSVENGQVWAMPPQIVDNQQVQPSPAPHSSMPAHHNTRPSSLSISTPPVRSSANSPLRRFLVSQQLRRSVHSLRPTSQELGATDPPMATTIETNSSTSFVPPLAPSPTPPQILSQASGSSSSQVATTPSPMLTPSPTPSQILSQASGSSSSEVTTAPGPMFAPGQLGGFIAALDPQHRLPPSAVVAPPTGTSPGASSLTLSSALGPYLEQPNVPVDHQTVSASTSLFTQPTTSDFSSGNEGTVDDSGSDIGMGVEYHTYSPCRRRRRRCSDSDDDAAEPRRKRSSGGDDDPHSGLGGPSLSDSANSDSGNSGQSVATPATTVGAGNSGSTFSTGSTSDNAYASGSGAALSNNTAAGPSTSAVDAANSEAGGNNQSSHYAGSAVPGHVAPAYAGFPTAGSSGSSTSHLGSIDNGVRLPSTADIHGGVNLRAQNASSSINATVDDATLNAGNDAYADLEFLDDLEGDEYEYDSAEGTEYGYDSADDTEYEHDSAEGAAYSDAGGDDHDARADDTEDDDDIEIDPHQRVVDNQPDSLNGDDPDYWDDSDAESEQMEDSSSQEPQSAPVLMGDVGGSSITSQSLSATNGQPSSSATSESGSSITRHPDWLASAARSGEAGTSDRTLGREVADEDHSLLEEGTFDMALLDDKFFGPNGYDPTVVPYDESGRARPDLDRPKVINSRVLASSEATPEALEEIRKGGLLEVRPEDLTAIAKVKPPMMVSLNSMSET